MPDENTTTDTTATVAVTTEQPASPPAEGKTFTQEDVNRIVAQRLAEDRARRPAQQPTPPKTPPAKPAEPGDFASEIAALKQQQADLSARLEFEKRTRGLSIEGEEADQLFDVYKASPAAFETVLKVVGQKSTSQPQQSQTQTAAPAPKPATEHPISNRGTPPPTQTPLEEIDLWTATESDRQAFIRSKGIKAYVTLLQEQGRNRPVRLQ